MDLLTGTEIYSHSGLLPYYYTIVFICALYVIHKFKYKAEAIFIVLLFTEGFFAYLSTLLPFFANLYKIGFVIFAFWLYRTSLNRQKSKTDIYLILTFLLIGVSYFISYYINDSNLLTTLSQYFKKYSIPLLIYFGIKQNCNNNLKMEWYANIFKWLLGFQILFQFLKFFFWGFGESIVGSINFHGGGAGNIIPVLGFLLIWLKRNGSLQKKDWFFIILLFLSISIIGNKRSIWFTMTFMVLYTHLIILHSVRIFKILRIIPLVILLFIIGAKANPTLNPENSRWGSLNLHYIIDYAHNYTFGTNETNDEIAQGRGGGSIDYIKKVSFNNNSTENLFGYGLDEVVIQDYDNFDNKKYGVASKGSTSAFVQNFIAIGIFGTFFIFFFGFRIGKTVKNIKFFGALILFLVFDYFLFYNSTITINVNAMLFIYICIYSNFKPFLKKQ